MLNFFYDMFAFSLQTHTYEWISDWARGERICHRDFFDRPPIVVGRRDLLIAGVATDKRFFRAFQAGVARKSDQFLYGWYGGGVVDGQVRDSEGGDFAFGIPLVQRV